MGDSILGYQAHMGAGAVISNVRADKKLVTISYHGRKIDTDLNKFGTVLGDHVEVGCGAVINPGSVIGKKTMIYPLASVRGVVKENSIYKNQDEIVDRR